MMPLRLAQPVQVARTVKLGADAKLVQAELTSGVTVSADTVYLQALHLQESNPTWEFSRTDTSDIRGAAQLALVVRAARHTRPIGTVELMATVRTTRFGLLAYQAPAPGPPSIQFKLM
jgi:hypothetical protein